jgi:hypothetical protein
MQAKAPLWKHDNAIWLPSCWKWSFDHFDRHRYPGSHGGAWGEAWWGFGSAWKTMAGVSAGVDLSKLHFHFPHLVGLCGSCGVMRKWSFCLWALIWAGRRPVDLQ